MKRLAPLALLALALPASAEEAVTPTSIVAAAPAADWIAIDPADLMVMELASDRDGNARRVVIQLMPAPFSQGWVGNIRKLAAAHWWDGTSVYRVQDNYVVQWGDVTEEKALPDGLKVVPESEYVQPFGSVETTYRIEDEEPVSSEHYLRLKPGTDAERVVVTSIGTDVYATGTLFLDGWPLGLEPHQQAEDISWPDLGLSVWPVHCYGMVGVARDLESTGTGSDLYVVIGHAPRQLDRNIALVGRVIEGIEHLSSLPRGHGELGFYADDEADKRVPILSVRIGAEVRDLPRFEYLSTDSGSFADYANSRANRQDDFYKVPAGGADICNVPVPIRRVVAQ
ncbi:peptidylprolyl isomerase [Erythrobacter sp. SG61-1L]|uniref:peptidylprolyl isomerase n=1 Tax=Erythrobacter sp. SG61-1L TaxID=1603897 RepID=UPI0006C9117E|nr:peptidylprolyl isomerase [Erythrobacter sp. SG61-1L]KPL68510.1 peptidylprolyl isomerase [Erythrobacter sp. SG61-1L]